MKGFKYALICGAAAMAFGTASPAAEIKSDGVFGWLSVGTTFQIEEGHLFWVGQFSGIGTDVGEATVFDKIAVQCPGTLDITLADGSAHGAGYCIWTAANGDKMFGSWQCAGGAPMSGKACDGTTTIISGTGMFAGATGTSTFQGFTVAFQQDGNGSGYSLTHSDYTLKD